MTAMASTASDPSGYRLRQPADGPWCWQAKMARRFIRRACDADHNVATALSVYDTLTEIASDEQSPVFTTTHAYVASMSGVSVRTVQKHLSTFVHLGLLVISTPRVKAPSTYTLIACAVEKSSTGNGCASFGNGGSGGSMPTSEELSKKQENNHGKSALIGIDPPPSVAAQITPQEIYDAYPRKQGRALALQAIQKAIAKHPPQHILDRVTAYAHAVAHWPESERHFIPHPATWFQRESYADDPRHWVRAGGGDRASEFANAF